MQGYYHLTTLDMDTWTQACPLSYKELPAKMGLTIARDNPPACEWAGDRDCCSFPAKRFFPPPSFVLLVRFTDALNLKCSLWSLKFVQGSESVTVRRGATTISDFLRNRILSKITLSLRRYPSYKLFQSCWYILPTIHTLLSSSHSKYRPEFDLLNDPIRTVVITCKAIVAIRRPWGGFISVIEPPFALQATAWWSQILIIVTIFN